jgi:hypothetical protein
MKEWGFLDSLTGEHILKKDVAWFYGVSCIHDVDRKPYLIYDR